MALTSDLLFTGTCMVMDTANTFYPDSSEAEGVTTTAGNSDGVDSSGNPDKSVTLYNLYHGSTNTTAGVLTVAIQNHAGTKTFWKGGMSGTGSTNSSTWIGLHIPANQGFRVVVTDTGTGGVPTVCLGYSFGAAKRPKAQLNP